MDSNIFNIDRIDEQWCWVERKRFWAFLKTNQRGRLLTFFLQTMSQHQRQTNRQRRNKLATIFKDACLYMFCHMQLKSYGALELLKQRENWRPIIWPVFNFSSWQAWQKMKQNYYLEAGAAGNKGCHMMSTHGVLVSDHKIILGKQSASCTHCCPFCNGLKNWQLLLK